MIKYKWAPAVLMEGGNIWLTYSSGLILKIVVFPIMEYLIILFLILYLIKSDQI